MSPSLHLALYVAGIVGGSLVGAAIPFVLPRVRTRAGALLAFSAGVMLGAACFHMLPEAVHEGGASSLAWALAGALFLLALERWLLGRERLHAELPLEVAPGHAGVAAFVGMSLHTLLDGIALGSAVEVGVGHGVFLAILLHKLPSAFSLATLLHTHHRFREAVGMAAFFVLMVPAGVGVWLLLAGRLPQQGIAAALAFSAGTFLHVALVDLIPDLRRHGPSRRVLWLALAAGFGLMAALGAAAPSHTH